MVVCAVKYRVLDVAHQVLKERTDHDLDNVAHLDVYSVLQVCFGMELLEFDAACDVLFCPRLVQLVERRERELGLIDILVEVK
jgi:hypothetical protein